MGDENDMEIDGERERGGKVRGCMIVCFFINVTCIR